MINLLKKNSDNRTQYEVQQLLCLVKEQKFFSNHNIQGSKELFDTCELLEFGGSF
jgi:hypothetical protein